MHLLKFDSNIRTRTTYASKIQFNNILQNRELYSFSFFKDKKVTTIIFNEQSIENWLYATNGNLIEYQKFGLNHNLPVVDAEIKIEKEEESKIEFYSTNRKGNKGNWSIGTYQQMNENIWRLSFSRVETFLGHNVRFDFTQEGDVITETRKFKWNYQEKGMELIGMFHHEYQFQCLKIEKLAERILSNGWEDNLVKNDLEKLL